MTLAVVFPGQGVPLADPAHAWCGHSPTVARFVEQVASAIDIPVAKLLHPSGVALRDTAVYQPVLIAVSVGAWLDVKELLDQPPVLVAGHSLGEISACVAAGVMRAEDAVTLAVERGAMLSEASRARPGGMVAISANSRESAQEAVQIAGAHGSIEIALHNAPDRWVLSGDQSALRAVPGRFAPTSIATGGAWHNSALAPYVPRYREMVRRALSSLSDPSGPGLLLNRTGEVMPPGDDLAEVLAGQLVKPVEWAATMDTMLRREIDTVVTIGPGRALRPLLQRGLGARVTLVPIEVPADLETLSARSIS
jgi:[acyl-carrier-protein] S-malonyltransferase